MKLYSEEQMKQAFRAGMSACMKHKDWALAINYPNYTKIVLSEHMASLIPIENYSFYLFCKLRDVVMPSEEPYDLQYEQDLQLYENYLKSEFNVDTKGEYECMVDFLTVHNTPYSKPI